MKQKLQSTNGLNAAGVGPKLFLFAMPGLLAGIILGIYDQSYSQWTKYTTTFSVYGGLVLLAIGIIVLIKKEEKQLLQVFGQQYEQYKKNVGRIGFLSF